MFTVFLTLLCSFSPPYFFQQWFFENQFLHGCKKFMFHSPFPSKLVVNWITSVAKGTALVLQAPEWNSHMWPFSWQKEIFFPIIGFKVRINEGKANKKCHSPKEWAAQIKPCCSPWNTCAVCCISYLKATGIYRDSFSLPAPSDNDTESFSFPATSGS